MKIVRLVWDDWNVAHIARHYVNPDEVEQACHNRHVTQESYQGRLILIAPTTNPEFASLEEEAKFWDTHDITDYLDEMRPVEVEFADHLSEVITVRLNPEMLNSLRAQAKRKGIGPSTLARMWIVEQLQRAEKG